MTDDPNLSAPQRLLMFIEDLLRLIEAQHGEAMRPRFFSFFRRSLPSPARLAAAQLRRFIDAFAAIIANLPQASLAGAAQPPVAETAPGSTSPTDPARKHPARAFTPRTSASPVSASPVIAARPAGEAPAAEPVAARTIVAKPHRARSHLRSARFAPRPRLTCGRRATRILPILRPDRSRKTPQPPSPSHRKFVAIR